MPAPTPTPGPDLAALRAAVARIEAGGSPHRPPRPPPDHTQSGGGHPAGRPEPAAGSGVGLDGAKWDGRRPKGDGRGPHQPEGAGEPGAARDPHAFAREIVLRQLAGAPKTWAQLRSKLAERECDPVVAEEVLGRMSEVGLVDDAAFTETYARSKQLTRGLSRRALAHELRGKGVADEVAAGVLAGIDEGHEVERARDLVRSRLSRLHGLDREVKLRRLSGLLARKGYPAGLVTRVVLEEVDAQAEHQRD